MQQDNNHIENKLRQLENQQLPDLSAMDAHWQQMQAGLAPNINPKQKSSFFKNNFKRLLFAASIIAALLIVYVVKYGGKNNHDADFSVNKNVEIPSIKKEIPEEALTDTLIKTKVVRLVGVKPISIKAPIAVLQWDSANKTAILKIVDSNTIAVPIPEISISSFYAQIQKPAQEFVIDASTGGEINAAEGSKIKIPPAAFIDDGGKSITGKIQILIEEYYKYSDMIAANLTTTSNNEQLVTGGMIKLTAVQNNKEVELRNDKSINLSMPTKNYDIEMKLFLAEDSRKGNAIFNKASVVTKRKDTGISNFYARRLNWQVTNPVNISLVAFSGKTNFLNMQDDPVKVREGRKRRVAKFHITNELPMTTDEAKKMLQEKYGDYYDVIKVKKVKPLRKGLFSRWFQQRQHIGDSTQLTVAEALKWHYIDKKDSAFYAEKTKRDSIEFYNTQKVFRVQRFGELGWEFRVDIKKIKDTSYYKILQDSLNNAFEKRQQVEQAYKFTVAKMGWINCDRFYNYDNKTDFVLDLPADVQAEKFVTQIVFTKIRSVMPGQYQHNKIGFLNIPVDMPVYVVGLGERNGKVVSFMQSLKTSAKNVPITTLEETTPEAFKEKLKQLDL